MKLLTKLQTDHNLGSVNGWEPFAEHRKKVTNLLKGESTLGTSRLCVLGAGNCNDLDLSLLLGSYREIQLVDLDAEALARGVAQQGLTDNPAVQRLGEFDVTGMLGTMGAWSPLTAIETADLASCIEEPLRRMRSVLPGPFDVVGSTCILSQLISAVVHAVGERHPRFLELVQAVRAGHLRLLMHLTAPGGLGVLITDIVSSDTFPGLASVAEEALSGVLAQLIRERNFFHGVNPAVLMSFFRTDPVLSQQAAQVEFIGPWCWNLGPRVYAVCALKVRKKSGQAC